MKVEIEPETEVELYLKDILERALARRGDWKKDVSGRLVHTLGLLNGGLHSGHGTIRGGNFIAEIRVK